MATRTNTIGWDRIELEYLAGESSVREIADRHEISDTAIRKRAKVAGWVRLPKKVRRPASRELAVRTKAPEAPPPADAVAIAEHGRQLVARLFHEIDAVTTYAGEIEDAIREECAGDENGRRRDAMLAAVSLGGRAKTLKEVATAFKTLNEAAAPQGKKAAQQEKADQIANRFRGVGPPTLKAVK